MGSKIKLIDSAHPTASKLQETLVKNNLLNNSAISPELKFYVTEEPQRAREIANLFFENKFPGKFEKINI